MSVFYNPSYSPTSSIISTVSSSYYPYSSVLSPLSPVSPVITPVNKITVGPYSTTVTSTNVLSYVPTVPNYIYNSYSDLNDGYLAQKQMVEHILYLVLDKWLYKDLCHLLKYLIVVDDKVKYIDNIDDYKKNKICDDSKKDVKLKADFIEENILGKNEMRRLLKRMIDELGYKWYEFPMREGVVMDTVERYLKRELKENIEKRSK